MMCCSKSACTSARVENVVSRSFPPPIAAAVRARMSRGSVRCPYGAWIDDVNVSPRAHSPVARQIPSRFVRNGSSVGVTMQSWIPQRSHLMTVPTADPFPPGAQTHSHIHYVCCRMVRFLETPVRVDRGCVSVILSGELVARKASNI